MHIDGDMTVGVFYCHGGSKFLAFDIDDVIDVKVRGIICTLERIGIAKQDIHVEFSGNKGYHVWLFIDGTLPIQRLVQFGKWVIGQMGEYRDRIELRPESEKGKGVKLPFALHLATGQRSHWVDHELNPIKDQIGYFLGIEPMHKDTFAQIIDNALQIADVRTLERRRPDTVDRILAEAERELGHIKPPVKRDSTLHKYAERLIKQGLTDDDLAKGHGRHYAQFFVACHYKELGYTEQQVIELVTEWALEQKRRGMAEATESFIRRDVARNVRQIFKHDLGLYDSAGRPFEVYKSDVIFASQFRNSTARKVLWAMIIWMRIYANDDGTFWMSQRTVQEMTGLSFATVNKWIRRLRDNGVIEIVKEGSYGKRHATVYRIPGLMNNDTDDHGVLITGNSYQDIFDQSYTLALSLVS
jgi:biotin operon repressor